MTAKEQDGVSEAEKIVGQRIQEIIEKITLGVPSKYTYGGEKKVNPLEEEDPKPIIVEDKK